MTMVADVEHSDSAGATAVSEGTGSAPGRNELGTISIDNRVVQKIAARAALEVPDVQAPTPHLLGRATAAISKVTPGAGHDALPQVTADVDGHVAVLGLRLGVRWPSPIPRVTSAVRDHVRNRLSELTGLTITEVAITVTELSTQVAAPPRVN